MEGKSQALLDKAHTAEKNPTTISSDASKTLWQCCNTNVVKMIELLKEGHDPNIKDAYGIGSPLLHLCKTRRAVHALCECPKLDITQKDNLGRNVLFYTFDWCVRDDETCLYDYFKAKGAKVVPDKFGRTLLHEWKGKTDVLKGGLSLEKVLEDFPDIDVYDCRQQTPLHVAVFQKNYPKVCKLLSVGSNPNAEDINGISPLMLACENPEMYQIFTRRFRDLEPLASYSQVHDDKEKAYFQKDYAMEHRPVFAIHKLFCKTNLQNSVDLFKTQFEEPLLRAPRDKLEFKEFKKSVLKFMTCLGAAIGRDDPLFEFSPKMSGSCSEGTKVIAMDETDVLCVFKHDDWETLSLKPHEENKYAFIKLESESFSRKHAQICKDTDLSVHGVFETFYTLVRKHAADALKDPKCKGLYIMYVDAILPNDYSICPMELVWSGKWKRWQTFSVDIVPAIPVSNKKVPQGLKLPSFMRGIVAVPKWTSSLIPTSYADKAFQLGFSATEMDFFYGMPGALREA